VIKPYSSKYLPDIKYSQEIISRMISVDRTFLALCETEFLDTQTYIVVKLMELLIPKLEEFRTSQKESVMQIGDVLKSCIENLSVLI
jgi:hypothetical protein